MYEELINSLRICGKIRSADDYCVAFHDGCCEAEPVCMYELMMKAADAIEKLSKLADAIPHVCECCVGCELEKKNGGCNHAFVLSPKRAKEYLSKSRWIPVTERLPEQRINQNTLDFEYVLCATTFGDVRPFKYGRRIGQENAHFWNGAGYVDAYVTHWTQLPEPPKEE